MGAFGSKSLPRPAIGTDVVRVSPRVGRPGFQSVVITVVPADSKYAVESDSAAVLSFRGWPCPRFLFAGMTEVLLLARD
jgi:hypothetical protein